MAPPFGVFPFTAVGESYLASGSFYGGASIPPDAGRAHRRRTTACRRPRRCTSDVSAYVPADNQTVQVGQVMVVGHDDSQPAGSQDTFLLDDSTLAWGQVNDPSSSAQIRVTKTQSLPGVGPDRQRQLLSGAGRSKEPTQPQPTLVALGAGLRGVADSSGLCRLDDQSWKRSADLTDSP